MPLIEAIQWRTPNENGVSFSEKEGHLMFLNQVGTR